MEKLKFSDVFDDITRQGTKIQANQYLVCGKYQIIDQSQNDIAGYTNQEEGLFTDIPAIVFGDHTRVIKYVDKPCFLGADGVKLLRAKDSKANYKYLYYVLTNAKIPDTGYNRHFKWLKEINIPLYDEETQNNIVKELEKVTNLIDKRKKQLEKLDELVKSRFIEMFGDCDLTAQKKEWKTVREVGTVVGGSTPKTSVTGYWNGEYRWLSPAELEQDSGVIFDSAKKITKAGIESCSLQELPVGTVILSSRAPIGKLAIAGNTFYCNQGFKNIVCSERVVPRYLYSLLLFNTEYLNSLGRGATFKEISKSIVENIKIPVPPIELQNQFAAFAEQVDKSKIEIKQSLEKLELLKKALMQKYFG